MSLDGTVGDSHTMKNKAKNGQARGRAQLP